jgi:uncharacterized protein (DUF1800 family)
MSRLGYGPSPALADAVHAAPSARDWALAQVDLAFDQSLQAPRIAADLVDFNQPLPGIFERARLEREARASIKAGDLQGADRSALTRMDFSQPVDPLAFSRRLVQQAAAWRLTACSRPDVENPLLARLTEFWFNHLNVYVGKGAVRPFTGHYVVNVARAHALGKFEDLVLASAHHPAMLLYLDQAQSVASGSPGAQGRVRGINENYARELMELHTLGVDGGYSQTDVRELARVLTGWTVGPNESTGFRFAPRLHDQGSKRVLEMLFVAGSPPMGAAEGEAAIRMLARHPRTAQRVCLRLAQNFVSDNPPPDLVANLQTTFLSSQGDLRLVMRALVESQAFWSADHTLFKTPMDFACSALTATQGWQDRGNLVLALGFLNNAGQPLHGWQTPDGYKTDAATWLVPEALTRRADFALTLARKTPELGFLTPFLGTKTQQAIAAEEPALRAGLALASPDFMVK